MKVFVLIASALLISTYIHAAKIYKCKNASGNVEFSNIRCKSADSGGLVAIDAPMKPSYEGRRSYKPSANGETDAARQLRLMKEASRRDRFDMERDKSERRSREKHDVYINAQRDKPKNTPSVSKAKCKENKARSKYWKERARQRSNSKSDKHLYESYQYMYKGKAAGC